MSDAAIRVENLSKEYKLGSKVPYKTVRESLTGALEAPLKWMRRRSGYPKKDLLWALKDVSFEVKRGEVLGVIGRNGAGKSTLLKVLSRITEPTDGRAQIRGRLASLLEVGTGFHPELTGRENIYMNGAILGMRRTEIASKFDEIVAFAEVEKFIDTPVKRYSSGMYMRLAFAVAAHLEPEILLVDEVLAVGDAAFQRKCLGRMQEVGKHGRTILFVSHNMSAIQALCSRCLVLCNGQLIVDDTSTAAVQIYVRDAAASTNLSRAMQANGTPTIIWARIENQQNETAQLQIDLKIQASDARNVSVDLRLQDGTGSAVGFGSIGSLNYKEMIPLKPGINPITLCFPTGNLALGSYMLSIDITLPNARLFDRLDNCLCFSIDRAPVDNADRVMSQQWGYGSYEIPITASVHPLESGAN